LVFTFIYPVQCVGQGIIRALGKQGVASIGTIIGYWVIGIPFSLLAVFTLDWGIVGLWLGPTLALLFNFCYYFLTIKRTDWQKIAEEVIARRKKE
jgi:multidrug resistance protein, MATE family